MRIALYDYVFDLAERELSAGENTHLAVPGGENGSEDLPVLLHPVILLLQRALHIGIGQHVFNYVLLQHPPQRSLIGAIKPKPRDEKGEKDG